MPRALSRRGALLLAAALAGCSPAPKACTPPDPIAPPPPSPACPEGSAEPGPWPRADRFAAVEGAHLTQPIEGRPRRLRFLGAHLFDLLDKLAHEAGPAEIDRRRLACAALGAAAAEGAPVVRLWGSLKRTGTEGELARAVELLALTLDENARRARPLRFVITLLNHQGGYGAPEPERSLDDQDPDSPWSARRIYLQGGWQARGVGQLEERIERMRGRAEIAASPYVLGWELVNELDTHRAVAGGSLRGPEATALRDTFLVPALTRLAASFPQPLLVGDLRGAEADYPAFARGVVERLPGEARARLVWTSHVYVEAGAGAAEIARATRKLDLDLALAAELRLPFLLGEIGERAPGSTPFCGEGSRHDPARLFAAVLDARPAIEAALFWGEGHCDLAVPGSARGFRVGAGGDSADLAPGDHAARAAVRAARATARFSVAPAP